MSDLTLGLVPASVGIILVATLETVIGLCLVTGRFLRLGLALLGKHSVSERDEKPLRAPNSSRPAVSTPTLETLHSGAR